MDTAKITTIKLKADTKSSLDKLKLIERESYDEVIQRLIQSFSKEQSELSSGEQSELNPEELPELSSEEQPELGLEEELESSSKTKEIVPEPTQGVKEEKVRLLRSILGSIENNGEEAEKKKDEKREEKEKKKEVKISSRFKYP